MKHTKIIALGLFALLIATVIVGQLWLPWVAMWALAFVLFACFKWITLVFHPLYAQGIRYRWVYLFGWVGMDPAPFRKKSTPEFNASLFWSGALNTVLGAALVLSAPYISNGLWLLQAWLVCVGIVLTLHFGAFKVLASLLRACGFGVQPIMKLPLAARSVSEFWGGRWNSAFKQLVFPFLYRPIAKAWGVVWGVLGTFLASGLIHELVISWPAKGGWGLPTLYFMLQASGLLIEKTSAYSRLPPMFKRTLTYSIVAGPAIVLFHPTFMWAVIVPFSETINALTQEVMMNVSISLETAVFLGGIAHLGMLGAGLVMTRVLRWKTELQKIDTLSQHIIWTHGAYVWLTILAFGLVSVFFADALTSSTPLGAAISGFIALFWGIRLLIQFFYFDAKPYLSDKKLKLGFHALTVCFGYFTVVYGWVLVEVLAQ